MYIEEYLSVYSSDFLFITNFGFFRSNKPIKIMRSTYNAQVFRTLQETSYLLKLTPNNRQGHVGGNLHDMKYSLCRNFCCFHGFF